MQSRVDDVKLCHCLSEDSTFWWAFESQHEFYALKGAENVVKSFLVGLGRAFQSTIIVLSVRNSANGLKVLLLLGHKAYFAAKLELGCTGES